MRSLKIALDAVDISAYFTGSQKITGRIAINYTHTTKAIIIINF